MVTKPLRTIIVDDEPEAINLLKILLEQMQGIDVIGEADCVEDAIQLVLRHRPDIVFLDIQMPHRSGFDLMEVLNAKGINPDYIFVTAFDEYAIKALKASAFDYLLKPVGQIELQETIARYIYKTENGNDKMQGPSSLAHSIKVNIRTGYLLIDLEDIVYCQADGNYTDVYLIDNRKETVTYRIGEFYKRLSTQYFCRISRSAIINLKYLIRVDTKSRTCKLKHYQSRALSISRSHIGHLESSFIYAH